MAPLIHSPTLHELSILNAFSSLSLPLGNALTDILVRHYTFSSSGTARSTSSTGSTGAVLRRGSDSLPSDNPPLDGGDGGGLARIGDSRSLSLSAPRDVFGHLV